MSSKDSAATVQSAPNTNSNNEGKAGKASARLITGQPCLEVYFTGSFPEFGQFEAWKDPEESKVGKFLFCLQSDTL